ncbi:MAG: hypothetical protein OXH65_03295 [Paracoccaceae bacterium]|nr:hypothetical protein [Paracoccaceae bacterium]MDE2674115.1 hypothetical protein [Paracoccaceae bacterium]
MALPVALVPALAAGGTLVPHAHGLIVVSATGGYVANTFLSSSAISTLLVGGGAAGGATGGILAWVFGERLLDSIGTEQMANPSTGKTITNTGALALATPVAVGLLYGLFSLVGREMKKDTEKYIPMFESIHKKLELAENGEEQEYTEEEGKLIQTLIELEEKRKHFPFDIKE